MTEDDTTPDLANRFLEGIVLWTVFPQIDGPIFSPKPSQALHLRVGHHCCK